MSNRLDSVSDVSVELGDVAEEAARRAGTYLAENFQGPLVIDVKSGYHDVVTEHDRTAESIISETIRSRVEGSVIVGEEGGRRGTGGTAWFVDPIDGTSNFAAGIPFFCVSIGVVHDGHLVAGAVLDPIRGELFRADARGFSLSGGVPLVRAATVDQEAVIFTGYPYEGIRNSGADFDLYRMVVNSFRSVKRYGSSALALAYVAAGRADVAAELNAHPWDIAAGIALVRAAGGCFLTSPDFQGDEWDARRYVAHGPNFRFAQSSCDGFLRG